MIRSTPLPGSPDPTLPATVGRRPRPDHRTTSRIDLLAFVWMTTSGCQPVLYAVRTYLH